MAPALFHTAVRCVTTHKACAASSRRPVWERDAVGLLHDSSLVCMHAEFTIVLTIVTWVCFTAMLSVIYNITMLTGEFNADNLSRPTLECSVHWYHVYERQ
jgi:hypothetical protein